MATTKPVAEKSVSRGIVALAFAIAPQLRVEALPKTNNSLEKPGLISGCLDEVKCTERAMNHEMKLNQV
jgi:hypothetical protein